MAQHQNIPATLAHLVAPLDKSAVPSSFLWDKGINGLAEPSVFDGHLYDSAFLQPTDFGFLYAQLQIDAGDGMGYRTINPEKLITIQYASPGSIST